ncbi:MAG: LicD family protein [Oscillospiraceae bacterium]|nr:LicD family protein [Oscillospiraceae bacterium]
MDEKSVQIELHKEHQQALCVLLEEFDRVCKALDIPYMLFAGTMLGAVRHQGFIPWDDDVDVILLRKDYDRLLKEAEQVLDSEKFYLQKEFSEHWPMFFSKLRLNNTTCLEKYHPKDPQIHQGVYIDIFPCDNCAKTGFGRKLQFLASKIVIAKALYKRGYETNSKRKKCFMQLCRLLPNKLFLAITKGGKADSAKVHSFLGGSSSYRKSVYPRKCFLEHTQATFEGKQYSVSAKYDRLLHILYGDYLRIPPEGNRRCKQHAILIDLENSYEQYAHYRDGMVFEIHTRSIR